ncbi:hypothetical protein GOODEAATRI_011810 [Goodea atripinnis]|uniref:Uncharacterized protein n=1 Tax=Goodea atripinnis TaxID=208336 RepID=A0ABV0NJF3_9TELE
MTSATSPVGLEPQKGSLKLVNTLCCIWYRFNLYRFYLFNIFSYVAETFYFSKKDSINCKFGLPMNCTKEHFTEKKNVNFLLNVSINIVQTFALFINGILNF